MNVEAKGYAEAIWCSTPPVFYLNATPALDSLNGDYACAVSVNHGAPIILTGSTYRAEEEGLYTVCFMVVAPDGSVVARSAIYSLCLDYTAPQLQIKTGNGTMQMTVNDKLSGSQAVSLDGGVTWLDVTYGKDGVASYSYTAKNTETFAKGMLMVRDWAGCVTTYQQEVTIRKTSVNRGGSKRSTMTAVVTTIDPSEME